MLGVLLLHPALAVEPAASLTRFASANGYGVIVLNGENDNGPVLDRMSDHLYQTPSADAADTQDLLYDTYFGLRAEGEATWLSASEAIGPVLGTNAVYADRSTGSLRITEVDLAPIGLDYPAFVQILYVSNPTDATVSDVVVTSLHNHHLGSDDDGDGASNDDEAIWVDDGALLEWGNSTGLVMSMLPIGGADTYSCDQVYNTLLADRDLDGRCGTADEPWTFDDQVGGFQWNLGDIAAGKEKWVGVITGFSSGWDTTTARDAMEAWVADRDPEQILDDEAADWADWLAEGEAPAGLSADERALYDQALIQLRAAQVREPGAAYGQIVASYPAAGPDPDFEHTWAITWVRDASYAIQALVASGHTAEARDALAFFLQGKAGTYASELGLDTYALSVCRTYGDGAEWSDDDGTGPNIELDGWGLYLSALRAYVDASGDTAFLTEHQTAIFDQTADLLVDLIEPSGDAQGLITADSSIWERHWNGNQKHFTYTSVWAARGLDDAAALATALGDAERAETYAAAAQTLRTAIAARLVSGGVLMGNLEEISAGQALDLAAVEAFNTGALDNLGAVALQSLEAWGTDLRVASGQGYFRNDDGGAYDKQEWIFLDLRVAEALRRACQPEDALALEGWVVAQAAENGMALPELLDPDEGTYAGPAPMLGFGAGAYVWGLHRRADADADCLAGADPGGDEGGGEAGGGEAGGTDDTAETDSADVGSANAGPDLYKVPTGCGCATTTAPEAAGLGAALAALAALSARRPGRRRSPRACAPRRSG